MTHKKTAIASVICSAALIMLLGGCAILGTGTEKSAASDIFDTWTADAVSSIDFSLNPQSIYVTLYDKAQISGVVAQIRVLKLGERIDEWRDSEGQTVGFNMRKADGEFIEIYIYGSDVVINGQGYKTENSEPCYELIQIGNDIGVDYLANPDKYRNPNPPAETSVHLAAYNNYKCEAAPVSPSEATSAADLLDESVTRAI
ncbi:MAG: hypothetical protein LBD85_01215 [Oscillospiraceae bacterium]|jgi:hypothetical protein|nr:hypothetical protein [Oscillospiraceae bacterium]